MRTIHGVKVITLSKDERTSDKQVMNERIRATWNAATLAAQVTNTLSFSEQRALCS